MNREPRRLHGSVTAWHPQKSFKQHWQQQEHPAARRTSTTESESNAAVITEQAASSGLDNDVSA